MTLACPPRELHETAEENTKLRKQISDLMVQNQQQVSYMGNINVWKLQVFQNNCSCSSLIYIACLIFALKESKIVHLEENIKSSSETMKGLEQKTEQDRVSQGQYLEPCQSKSSNFSCRILTVCLDRTLL